MRIVSGKYRSRKLKSLKGDNTRPTSDKIRAAIFDSISFNSYTYKTMLDLFSGSGAMGIEAISRGFEYVVFNDKDRSAIKIINENIKDIGVSKQSKVYSFDYKRTLKLLENEQLDLIFIDPPYDQVNIVEIIEDINKLNILNPKGIIIIEGSNSLDLDDNISGFIKYKEKTYKATKIIYYEKG